MPDKLTRRKVRAAMSGASVMAVLQPTYRIIDSHGQCWKNDSKYPWAKETTRIPDKDATPEMLLGLMKANGVARTVIIQVIYYRWDNSYLADVLKRYRSDFHGVARVNPEDPAAPDHLSKLVEVQGFRGVRLSPSADSAGDWIAGPMMPPLWERCRSLKVPRTILAPVSRMPDVGRLMEKFPDLTLVIDHMASSPLDKPVELEKLIALKRYPRAFVKISHAWSLSRQ